ncbi:MAG: type II secretion system F family protein [Candidatus Gastranaerophilales bacterium]|nr:type II secretion system F family protein [Candidatus Gastranaerophilales bacterium]
MYRELNTKEKYEFFNLLYSYVKSQVPILTALNFIAKRSSSSYLRTISKLIVNEISSGTTLIQVFEKFKPIFGNIYSTLLISGESVGKLEAVLSRILHLLKRKIDFQSKVTSALTYPAVIVNMLILSVCLYNFFVIPFMEKILAKEAVDTAHMAILAAIKTGLIIAFLDFAFLFLANPGKAIGKLFINIILAFVPKARRLAALLYWAEFFLVFSTSYEAGASMVTACELAASTMEQPEMKGQLNKLSGYILNGSTLTQAFINIDVIPSEYISLIAAGEETGELHKTFDTIIADIDTQVDTYINVLTKTLEPLIILLIGIVIAKISASLYIRMNNAFTSAM